MQGNDLEIYQAANDLLTRQLRHEKARADRIAAERDAMAAIVTRNDGAVERSQGLARELGEALTRYDAAVGSCELLNDEWRKALADKAELVAVLHRAQRLHITGGYSKLFRDEIAAALAKHGGDKRAARGARLSAQGFEGNRFCPHTGARIEDDDER